MIKLENVQFSYDKEKVLSDFSYEFETSKIYALTGPSGKGKTTLLRLMSGLLKANSGTIKIGENVVDGESSYVKPNKREVGLVFQDYALFPHLNVIKNVAYAAKSDKEVEDMLELVKMTDLKTKNVSELSGGQKQRVAIARTLVTKPKILLLDEPFSNLDDDVKKPIKKLIKNIVEKRGLTVIIVSHNKEDYLDLVDEVISL